MKLDESSKASFNWDHSEDLRKLIMKDPVHGKAVTALEASLESEGYRLLDITTEQFDIGGATDSGDYGQNVTARYLKDTGPVPFAGSPDQREFTLKLVAHMHGYSWGGPDTSANIQSMSTSLKDLPGGI